MEDRYHQKNFPAVTSIIIIISTALFFAGFKTHLFILYMFSHGALYHLFINMLALWIFGSFIESRIGWKLFLVYFLVSAVAADMLWRVMDTRHVIGSSGAISGLMSFYFFRCHYLKVKPHIPVRLLVINLRMHAGWFLYYWLIWHVYSPFSVDYHTAYVGGLIAGIIIGKFKNKSDDLYDKAVELIDAGIGIVEAEESLLKALEFDQGNPDIKLELARLYSMRHEKDSRESGRKFYLEAARGYYQNRERKYIAGRILLEFHCKYRETIEPETHIKYANELARTYDYNSAFQLLEPIIEKDNLPASIGERAYHNYIEFTMQTGSVNRAKQAFERFRTVFPESLLIRKAEVLLSKPVPKIKSDIELKMSSSRNTWSNAFRDIINNITDVTSDIETGNPWASDLLFWEILFILVLLSPLLLIVMELKYAIVFIIAVPFVVSMIRRCTSSFFGSIYSGAGRKSEAEGLREFNLSHFMDRAESCETEEKYDEAITYLRGVLKEDRENVLAQFRIARLYHKKLDRPAEARREYKKIVDTAPEDHPLRRDAIDSIKELSSLSR